MRVNADFSQRVVVHAARLDWEPSPVAGVERRMLDRVGDEVARATSVVRFAPASRFPAHTHGGGEEFFVLEGVFQDETGDFPAGSYVRNPPTSRHTPRSAPGCVLLVKLWQFDPHDRTHVRIDTARMPALPAQGRPGVELVPLFQDEQEFVRLERWTPGTEASLHLPGGAELFVLEGELSEAAERLEPMSWLRLPPCALLEARAGPDGCKLWVKSGHLLHMGPLPEEH